jgi:Zn-dependent alcohol dehydrogenase
MFGAGKLKLRELITEVLDVSEINTAIQHMRDGSLAGRCLVRFSGEGGR